MDIDENTKELKIEFMKVDEKEFVEKEIDITDIASAEELIEKINEENYDKNKYYKLILVGNKIIEINTNEILKNVMNENIIKIKDKTKFEINLEALSKQNNLKGIFVRNLMQTMIENPEEKETILKAIQIGLSSF